MNTPAIEDALREKLAAIEHERWSDWQKYLHSKLTHHNGVKGQCKPGLLMSPSDYHHWEEQIAADYSELSDAEKASDMEQVDRYWPLITAHTAQAVELAEIESEIDALEYIRENKPSIQWYEARIALLKERQALTGNEGDK